MKKAVILLSFIAIISGCISRQNNSSAKFVTLTGKIEQLGMSTYQYGTHLISANDKTYALKSTKVNLNDYEGKTMIVKGMKVSGYPIENGPELIDVTEVLSK